MTRRTRRWTSTSDHPMQQNRPVHGAGRVWSCLPRRGGAVQRDELLHALGPPGEIQIAKQRLDTSRPAVIGYAGIFRRVRRVGVPPALHHRQLLLGEHAFQQSVGPGLGLGPDHADGHLMEGIGRNGGHRQPAAHQQFIHRIAEEGQCGSAHTLRIFP